MKGPGIFSMLQIAAGLSMAGPMFVVGFEFVRTDRVIAGVGFFLLGAIALYAPTYLVKRIGGPRTWLRRLASGLWSRVRPGTRETADESRGQNGSGHGQNGSSHGQNESADPDDESAHSNSSRSRLERFLDR